MNDRVFLDTNIIIYLYSEDEDKKRDVSRKYLNNACSVTSVQAMNEASNVWIKKHNLDKTEIIKYLNEIEFICDEIMLVRRNTIDQALDIKTRFGYSFYDSLMLASAIEANCNIILTEDMKNRQIINGTLKIINPFFEQ